MATLTHILPAIAHPRPRRRPVLAGPVVVTSYGDLASDGAIRLALAIAARSRCGVRLIAVLEPAPLVAPEFGAIVDIPDDRAGRRAALERALATQMDRLGVVAADVDIDVEVGDPASVIMRAAADAGARLVVLGAAHHDLLDRVFGTDTAVRVARGADVPVLIVPGDHGELPRSAVFAIDFSEDSVRAGRAALELFPELRELRLVHVGRHVEPALRVASQWEAAYDEAMERAFDRVREALPVPVAATVRREIVRGNPARELLRVAAERGADLIVAGSHGRGAFQRIFVGSVATALVRGAGTAVLVLPVGAGEQTRDSKLEAHRDPSSWPRALDEFSARNEGRRATLEMNDPELGARAQEIDYPFRGCVYDPFDGRLAIMLGEGHPGTRHLMRGISGVVEVDILRDESGRDRVLRIAHGRRGGHTMLIFTS